MITLSNHNPNAAVRLLLAAALLATFSLPVQAEETGEAEAPPPTENTPTEEEKILRPQEDTRGTFSFTLENDYFAGEDDGYTNGFRLSWLSSESGVPHWLESGADWFPLFSSKGHKRYGFAMGQTMYAPDDLTQRNLIANDRPYAGLLYGSVGVLSDTGYRLDNLQLSLGVVGPASLAAQTQDAVHHLRGSTDPQGWDNQLENEPAVILSYERKWRGLIEMTPFGLGADVTPFIGGSLGNVHTHLSTGATFRIGYDLPADYGPPLIRPNQPGSDFFVPTRTIGWYLFAGFEGRAVGRNIFLDGNSFRDSHSVDKKHFVGSLQAGIAFTYDDIRLAYTHILRTREFDEQQNPDEFGAVTLSYRF